MDWYYAAGSERKGPISDEEFQRLVQQGVVTPQTLIWRQGMVNWEPYGGPAPVAGAAPAPLPGSAVPGYVTCANCQGTFPQGEIVLIANQPYCANCKPLAVQSLREGVALNTDAEAIRQEHIKHEASVKSVGVLYYLGAIAMVVMGVFSFVGASALGGRGGSGGDLAGAGVGVVFIALGVGQFIVGTGLRKLRKWARIPTGILSGFGLLGFPIGTLINAYILYLVFSRKGKMVFSDEYKEIVEQTPHIRYRTSIVVWIVLGIVVALCAFGILGGVLSKR